MTDVNQFILPPFEPRNPLRVPCAVLAVLFGATLVGGFWMFLERGKARSTARIAAEERVITDNQEAFRQMAIAGASMQVVQVTGDGSSGPGFVFIIRDAIGANMIPDGDHKDGCVFFASPRKRTEIQRMQQQTEKVTNAVRQ